MKIKVYGDLLKKNKVKYFLYLYLIATLFLTVILKRDLFFFGNIIIIIIIASLFLLKNKHFLVYLTIILSILHEGISPLVNGVYIVIYFYLLMLISIIISGRKIKTNKYIFISIIIVLILSLVTAVVNGTPLTVIVFSIIKRFGFFIVYLYIINIFQLTEAFKRILSKSFILLLILNFSVALFQFSKGTFHQDYITGFLGGNMTGIVIYLFMYYIAILSGMHYKKKVSTLLYLILVFIPIIYSAIAEVKIGFVATAVLLIVYFVFINKSYKSIIIIVICAFIFVSVYSFFVSIYPNHNFLNQKFLEKYLVEQSYGNEQTINRFGFKTQIDSLIFSNEVDKLFGLGIGSGNPSELELLKGNLYDQYDYLKYRWFTLPYLYVESGVIGTVIYIYIYLIPLFIAILNFKKWKSELSLTIILMSLTNFLFIPYNAGLFDYGVTTVFWIYVAFLFTEKRVNKKVIDKKL